MSRNELLKKIESLAYNQSFESLSLSQIANELGIKKSSLYYYFPSKQAMQIEIIHFSFNTYFQQIQKIFSEKKLNDILLKYFEYLENTESIFSQIMQKGYCNDEEMIQLIEEKHKEIQHYIFEILGKNFSFSKEKSFVFFSLLQDFSIKKCIFGKCDISQEDLITQIIHLFK